MKRICPVCGEKTKCKIKLSKKVRICIPCSKLSPNYTAESLEDLIKYHQEQTIRRDIFNKSKTLRTMYGTKLLIDEANKLFYIGKKKDKTPMIYRYDEVVSSSIDYHIKQKVAKKRGALGGAIVGGALFGGVGAVVGAANADTVIDEEKGLPFLKIILNTSAGERTLELNEPTMKQMQFFEVCMKTAAIKHPSTTSTDNSFDKVREFKKLHDDGIITDEEFEAKKKELLNL